MHPAALESVKAPKPMPLSFGAERYFAVNAYKFTNKAGNSVYGRYRITPAAGAAYFDPADAARQPPDYLFDELRARMAATQPIRLEISVQIANPSDPVDDSTIHWPDDRLVVPFGTVTLSALVPDQEAEQRHIIFDPIPRGKGIEPSGDPVLLPMAETYLMSRRRRRSGGASSARA